MVASLQRGSHGSVGLVLAALSTVVIAIASEA